MTLTLRATVAEEKPIYADEIQTITVVDNGSILRLVRTFPIYDGFSEISVLPYYDHLTENEQNECARLFKDEKLAVLYDYDRGNHKQNDSDYIVDNAKYILSLRNDGINSDFVKYAMIVSLGKMTFLSKRNIDLIFSMRGFLYSAYGIKIDKNGKPMLLQEIFSIGKLLKPVVAWNGLYDPFAENKYYSLFTLFRWFRVSDGMSLRDIVKRQKTLGPDVEEIDLIASQPHFPPRASAEITSMALSKNFGEFFDGSTNSESSQFNGLLDCSTKEAFAYALFGDWQNNEGMSLTDFLKQYSVTEIFYTVPMVGFMDLVREGPFKRKGLSLNNLSIYTAYFVFCLLNADEGKLFRLIKDTTLLETTLPNECCNTDLLDFVKDYSKVDTHSEIGFLMAYHGLNDFIA